MRNIVVSRCNHVGFLKRRCFTTKLEADKQGGDSLPFPCIYMLYVYRWPASLRRKPHARVQWRAASWRWRSSRRKPHARVQWRAASWRWRIRPGRVCDDARPDVAAVRRGCRACDDAAAAGRAVLRAARRTPCSAAAKRRLWRAGQRGPARHQCQNYAAGPGTLLACQSQTTRLKPACACDTDHARQTCNTCENACPVYPPATNTDHARQTCLCMQHGSRPSNQHARRITSVNCAEPPASLADTLSFGAEETALELPSQEASGTKYSTTSRSAPTTRPGLGGIDAARARMPAPNLARTARNEARAQACRRLLLFESTRAHKCD